MPNLNDITNNDKLIKEIGDIVKEAVDTNISNYRIGFYVIIGVAILYFVVVTIIQFCLKSHEIKVIISIEKKKEVLKLLKSIYNLLKNIQVNLNDINNKSKNDEDIRKLRHFVRQQEIELPESSIKIINTLLDKFSSANIDKNERKRDLENKLFKDLKNEYKKI